MNKGIKREVDISQWNRAEHFNFFSTMDNPLYGICLEVDATLAFKRCKNQKISFFLFYMHAMGKALQEVESFRYRIEDGKLFCYDFVELGSTIGREDETFGFALLRYNENFDVFCADASKEIEQVNATPGICLDANHEMNNVVFCSTIPWLRFTGLTHAMNHDPKDSVPRITFGKCSKDGDSFKLPVAIYVHHALVDAIHIGKLVDRFQHYLDCP
ncbi:chloramphenicol acetyltransferase [Halosquirtibacter laminarini]|uniref:Chloramphenicol acetyltransferase n=1 Tax=Halosquirtibacter laminarini TaxID=3374600 RepID=A0AC61NFS6_9BACT|nr:chloramphenicol acetyltransferase [Prolixibacteraceae bacterium]